MDVYAIGRIVLVSIFMLNAKNVAGGKKYNITKNAVLTYHVRIARRKITAYVGN